MTVVFLGQVSKSFCNSLTNCGRLHDQPPWIQWLELCLLA